MNAASTTYPVRLGFMPEAQAIPDPEHPGLRRAGPRAAAPYGDDRVEFHLCDASDVARSTSGDLGLRSTGFDLVDISALDAVQSACRRVCSDGSIDAAAAAAIRGGLDGALLRTSCGQSVRVLYISDEGFIMRTAGPNGRSVVGPRSVGMNGHGGATSVHIDQDVYGTPLVQLMEGRAPSLFVHDSPDGSNHDGAMFLVNMWIPLRQVVQPLALADGRTIDRRRHQLRYGLSTGSFLSRDEDQEINDIWTLLFDGGQEWYLHSEMDHRSAWMFNTLSVAHGACTLPGEDVAEECFLALEAAEAAVAAGDPTLLERAGAVVGDLDAPDSAPPALRAAIRDMIEVLQLAADDPVGTCRPGADAWTEQAALARRQVVRMSLELRLVVAPEA
ncbi:MAG: hypothetical protein ACKOYM_04875 [Actinomycetes bacterium]